MTSTNEVSSTEGQVDTDLIVDDQLDDLEREVTNNLRQTVRTIRTAYLSLHRIIEDIKGVANIYEETEVELLRRGPRIAVEIVRALVDGGDELLRENEDLGIENGDLKMENEMLRKTIVNMALDRHGPPPPYEETPSRQEEE